MKNIRIKLGKLGEDIAVQYLIDKGYRILKRNYRCSLGEIDVIAEDKDVVVFVEVRLKTGNRFGSPAESLTEQKARKIRRVAEYYLNESGEGGRKVRFDFFGVSMPNKKYPQILHLTGAF